MKTASLAAALAFALAAGLALAQEAPAPEAPAQQAPDQQAPDQQAPDQQAPAGEAPAGADAEPQTGATGGSAEGAPPAEAAEGAPGTGEEGAVEPVEAEPVYVMPELPVIGAPTPGAIDYPPAATELAHDVHWLSNWVHGVMTAVVVFVVVLIGVVIVRYNRGANPNPSQFTHNTRIEIAWTLVPVLILILIGSFSLPILFKQLEIPDPDLTVKVTGNQWFWSYEYPDNEFSFESLMLEREDLAEAGYADELYLLATDTALVVPVGAVVKLQVTSSDVIHSWTIPSFGVKMDGIPGRLNETWFEVEEAGVFFGQCSELCGQAHAYMPITVKALSQADYDAWLDWAIDEYGGTRGEPAVAQAN